MPRLSTPLGALYMSVAGANELLGIPSFQMDEVARTETLAGDGQYTLYRSGTSIFLTAFNKVTGAWVSVELT